MRRSVPGVLLALLTTAGCGTTVPLTTTQGSVVGDGLGAVAIAVPNEVAGAPGIPGAAVGTVKGGSIARATGNAPDAALQTGGADTAPVVPVAPGDAGRGVSATTLTIGVVYQANLDAANRAVGGGAITSGDQLAEVHLLVKDINSRGGIAGRKLAVDTFAYDAQSSQPYAVQDQAACAHFSQDVAVFAVVGAGSTSTFQECMDKAGTAVIGADIVRFDGQDLKRYPHYFDVQQMDLDRLVRALATELSENGWATGWNTTLGRPATTKAKVGVVGFDQPRYTRAVKTGLVPELRRRGFTVADADVVLVNEPTGQADIGQAAAQVQNAVLRFAQDGVTHVVLLDTHGGITQVFLNAADSQRYYPRYGMESGSGTQALLDGGIIRTNQLRGARGLGWIPSLDLPSASNPDNGKWSSDDRRACIALMKAGGQSFASTNAESIALLYCDQFGLLDRALDTITTPTLVAFTAAVEGLGARAPRASLGAASYGPGKHVGVARGIEWAFDEGCNCMTYGRARTLT